MHLLGVDETMAYTAGSNQTGGTGVSPVQAQAKRP
jgi:hypothetical protein